MRTILLRSLLAMLFVALIVSILFWAIDVVTPTIWLVRLAAGIVAFAALAAYLAMRFRRDELPDYLRTSSDEVFNASGLCFTLQTEQISDTCYLRVAFQNQFGRPCNCRLALRPAREFFLVLPQQQFCTAEIECGGGEFGVARIPLGVPKNLQGKSCGFELGATTHYTNGRGPQLRFYSGRKVSFGADFRKNFSELLSAVVGIAGLLAGNIAFAAFAQIRLPFPANCHEEVPPKISSSTRILWRPGDAPLR